MNTTTRIFWLLALMTFTCGCSTIRTVSLPGDNPVPGEREDTDQVVGIGDKVTLELRHGSPVTGTILEITAFGVSLQEEEPLVGYEIEDSPVEAPPPLTIVPREEIVTITKKVGDTGKSVLLVALIGIAVIGVATADYDWGGGEWDGTWEGGIMTH